MPRLNLSRIFTYKQLHETCDIYLKPDKWQISLWTGWPPVAPPHSDWQWSPDIIRAEKPRAHDGVNIWDLLISAGFRTPLRRRKKSRTAGLSPAYFNPYFWRSTCDWARDWPWRCDPHCCKAPGGKMHLCKAHKLWLGKWETAAKMYGM